jgi:hypothetical protein
LLAGAKGGEVEMLLQGSVKINFGHARIIQQVAFVGRRQCSLLLKFFSPASIRTFKRFSLGGMGHDHLSL